MHRECIEERAVESTMAERAADAQPNAKRQGKGTPKKATNKAKKAQTRESPAPTISAELTQSSDQNRLRLRMRDARDNENIEQWETRVHCLRCHSLVKDDDETSAQVNGQDEPEASLLPNGDEDRDEIMVGEVKHDTPAAGSPAETTDDTSKPVQPSPKVTPDDAEPSAHALNTPKHTPPPRSNTTPKRANASTPKSKSAKSSASTSQNATTHAKQALKESQASPDRASRQ
jgi:hypothetical protein